MPIPDNGEKWGIFGGAFDPVHNGHLTLAREIRLNAHLDGILFVPSFVPPRKVQGCVASFQHRFAMLGLATADDKRFGVTDIESERDEPGYTLHTVRALKKRFPGTALSFIIGADLLTEIETWFEAMEIIKEVPIIAGTRPGAALKTPAGLPSGAVSLVPTSPVDLASHDIRARIAAGITLQELSRMMPPVVAQYILDEGLYR
ncbi:nicotinate (nicotinamide) nucleotide adenylyltransferase [candidate division GN15 bacterium]|uniref:Probable nicotinate-nucleotide adenylyltransferase n=1 Tax=candidate division GN15 bacterium TaxID=2072418 RepID=A0A855XB74_9BACT|nr:MAG: nicotinate (nicotinamide) nucleotide adenylyltransferase [candidate division GN15 bacterium]